MARNKERARGAVKFGIIRAWFSFMEAMSRSVRRDF